jgi:hypothetical protein
MALEGTMSERSEQDTAQLKWRTKEPLRAAIEQSAKKRGLSINQEITRRIEASFVEERRVDEAFGNSEIFGIMKIAATAFVEAGRLAAHSVSAKNFVENPFAYNHAVIAAAKVLEAFRPSGEIVPPPKTTGLSGVWGDAVDSINLKGGELTAERILDDFRRASGIDPVHEIHSIDKDGNHTPIKASRAALRLKHGVSDSLARRLRVKKGKEK